MSKECIHFLGPLYIYIYIYTSILVRSLLQKVTRESLKAFPRNGTSERITKIFRQIKILLTITQQQGVFTSAVPNSVSAYISRVTRQTFTEARKFCTNFVEKKKINTFFSLTRPFQHDHTVDVL